MLIPRTDDCIAILLSSRRACRRQFSAEPATYCLSKGWLLSGSHPLSEHEEHSEMYGEEKAQWILHQQYQDYGRVALVAHSRAALQACAPAAREEVAEVCERWGMRYEEILRSDADARRLLETAVTLRDGDTDDRERISPDFVGVPPGGEERSIALVPVRHGGMGKMWRDERR